MRSDGAGAVRSVAELVAALDAGAAPKWLLFWGHRPERSGEIGKGCLSQWWPCLFTVDGVGYASAEHWMMAGKARLFGDDEALARILAARTPAEAKKLGRSVRDFDRQVWESRRYGLVVDGNVAKFGQDPRLREFLLGTGSRVLVEASPYDRIWGAGVAVTDERATDPGRWPGTNLLGFALMQARELLGTYR
ncbi:NADAR family protein [Actinocatenispora sera]|uniref:NADAR family protein n=1 Tax=Actinocatenispora sera TaxID=390989 RepID=UPI0033CEC81A